MQFFFSDVFLLVKIIICDRNFSARGYGFRARSEGGSNLCDVNFPAQVPVMVSRRILDDGSDDCDKPKQNDNKKLFH